ncbi:Hypothetical protein NTJ_00645 [Nesidiocoris tenuis]|uniref:Uncharacterized protein n=1 Tax=Nesidiocoris tenuis TaxID=355587 RepID=A0ABN7A9M3_9HEMI|nr:Hypothetical protein NTJ_00645 [Nesidiocoris tenuis]
MIFGPFVRKGFPSIFQLVKRRGKTRIVEEEEELLHHLLNQWRRSERVGFSWPVLQSAGRGSRTCGNVFRDTERKALDRDKNP